MLRVSFLALVSFIILSVVVYSIYSFHQTKKTRLAVEAGSLFLATAFTMFFYSATLVAQKRSLAGTFYSFYFASIDWLLFTLLNYVRKVILKKNQIKGIQYLIGSLLIFTAADTLSMLINILYDSAFVLRGSSNAVENAINWTVQYLPGYKIHLILCYVLTIPTFIGIIRTAIKNSTFYTRPFLIILFTFSAYYILNGIFLKNHWALDYSILLFGPMSTEIFIVTFYYLPRGHLASMLKEASGELNNVIVCFDMDEKCFYLNEQGTRLFGEKNEGRKAAEQFLAKWSEEYINIKNYNNVTVTSADYSVKIGDRNYILCVTYQRHYDEKQRIIASFLSIKDRTAEIKMLEAEHYKATHDSLTDMLNRDAFFADVERIVKKNPDTVYYFLCTDILNFKFINEVFGKEIGDKILRFEAMVIKNDNTIIEASGRINGDIFGLLIRKENYNEQEFIQYTENVLNLSRSMSFKMSMQIGVYEITNPEENVVSIYDKAHIAVQNIRSNYGKIIGYYDKKIMEQMVKEKTLLGEYQKSLIDGQFKMYIQPQIKAATDEIIGGEALVRWEHPEKGILPPDEFVKVLEKNGCIYNLDHFIWEEAAKTLSDWKKGDDQRFKGLSLSVNISTKDFYQNDLYKVFTELVQKYDVDPKLLKLEVTETVIVKDTSMFRTVLDHLQDYGFVIEMDDFGSGYSSLNALKDFSMNVIKIDMEFLRKSENEERSSDIVKLIIKMAKEIGMEVITEGVEKESHVNFLREAGCDIFQGYYFAKPMNKDAFIEFVKRGEPKEDA